MIEKLHSFRRQTLPGLLTALIIAIAAMFVSEHYGGPIMLYALLFGMAFHFLSETPSTAQGIQCASKHVLHVGVALLGVRMSADHFLELGFAPIATVILGVVATIFFGVFLARALGLSRNLGLISGCSVAICGASAALAVSSVVPRDENTEKQTLFTIIAVTSLSTLCMILYPLLVKYLGLVDQKAGILLGATIHDVAQVVAAGYMISPEAGDNATIVKLLRVAMLVPVCVLLALGFAKSGGGEAKSRAARVPWFLTVFILLAAINSFHYLPQEAVDILSNVSRWCLVVAIAAIGVKTSLGELRHVGVKPVILVVSETIFLLLFVLASLWMFIA